MPLMQCGCKIVSDNVAFEKKIYNELGLFVNLISLNHDYKQYVNLCGSCDRKETLFNDIEKEKLKLAREQFKILTETF